MSEFPNKKLGYLQSCMDRRFVDKTRQAFEEETGLKPDQYWHESKPGGAAKNGDPLGENYAASNGAYHMGWQAHMNVCGGLPNTSDEAIEQTLDDHIKNKKMKFPDRQHYRIVASEDGVDIKKL